MLPPKASDKSVTVAESNDKSRWVTESFFFFSRVGVNSPGTLYLPASCAPLLRVFAGEGGAAAWSTGARRLPHSPRLLQPAMHKPHLSHSKAILQILFPEAPPHRHRVEPVFGLPRFMVPRYSPPPSLIQERRYLRS